MRYKQRVLHILEYDDNVWAERGLKKIDTMLKKFKIGPYTAVSRENYFENRGVMSMVVPNDLIGEVQVYYNITDVYILNDKYYGHINEDIVDMDIYPDDNLVYNMKKECFEPNKRLRDKFFEMYKMGMLK